MSPLLVSAALLWADKTPEPDDVKAGWTAFAIFLLLGAAVVLLGFSLTKQLRKASQRAEQGYYDPSTKKRPPRPHQPEA